MGKNFLQNEYKSLNYQQPLIKILLIFWIKTKSHHSKILTIYLLVSLLLIYTIQMNNNYNQNHASQKAIIISIAAAQSIQLVITTH